MWNNPRSWEVWLHCEWFEKDWEQRGNLIVQDRAVHVGLVRRVVDGGVQREEVQGERKDKEMQTVRF